MHVLKDVPQHFSECIFKYQRFWLLSWKRDCLFKLARGCAHLLHDNHSYFGHRRKRNYYFSWDQEPVQNEYWLASYVHGSQWYFVCSCKHPSARDVSQWKLGEHWLWCRVCNSYVCRKSHSVLFYITPLCGGRRPIPQNLQVNISIGKSHFRNEKFDCFVTKTRLLM